MVNIRVVYGNRALVIMATLMGEQELLIELRQSVVWCHA